MSEFDLMLLFPSVSFEEAQLGLLLGYLVARFLELLPVRRKLQRFVVLGERLFGLVLLRRQGAPNLQRIGPMRSL
jgi:hypothetical protein